MHDHYQWLNSKLMRSHLTELKWQSVLLLRLEYGGGKKYDSHYEGEIFLNESAALIRGHEGRYLWASDKHDSSWPRACLEPLLLP